MRYFSGRSFLKLKDQLFEYQKVISSYQPETPRTSADLVAQLLLSPAVYVIPVQKPSTSKATFYLALLPKYPQHRPVPMLPAAGKLTLSVVDPTTPASTASSRLKRSTARPVT